MVCQRDCFNCGCEDEVRWRENYQEYLCDECNEIMNKEVKKGGQNGK